MVDMGVDLVREALSQALLLAAPILLAGLVIGLIVSIFQTVTQVQEQTLSFVPKIAGMILVGIAIIPWIINVMIDYATTMFTGN